LKRLSAPFQDEVEKEGTVEAPNMIDNKKYLYNVQDSDRLAEMAEIQNSKKKLKHLKSELLGLDIIEPRKVPNQDLQGISFSNTHKRSETLDVGREDNTPNFEPHTTTGANNYLPADLPQKINTSSKQEITMSVSDDYEIQ